MADLNNASVYKDMTITKVYAKIDNDGEPDGNINKTEAKKVSGSIFGKTEDEVINDALNGQTKNSDVLKNIAKSLYRIVIDGFKNFGYDVVEVEGDSVNSKQAEVDNKVESEVNRQSDVLMEQFKTGLADKAKEYKTPVTYTRADTTVEENDKKGDNEKYTKTSDELKQNGFKVLTREVNGTKQEIFVGKDDNGNKVRYIIDDDGKKHELVETSTAGKNKYTIKDDLENAYYKIDELGDDIKLKRRKVDGHYQTVIIDNEPLEDGTAKSYIRIIGHDNNSGESIDRAAYKIETRGKDKFASHTSGQAKAIELITYKFKDFATITGDFTKNEQVVITFHDGVTYTLKPIDTSAKKSIQRQIAQSNDDTMVKIYNHYFNHLSNIGFDNSAQDVSITEIEDTRDDAKYLIDNGRGHNDTIGDEITGYGSSQGPSGRIRGKYGTTGAPNVINYQTQATSDGYQFTRSDFAKEGWKRSSGGTREAEILSGMQTSANEAISRGDKNAKYVRNLPDVNAFTRLYIESYLASKDIKNVNLDKLANAIKVANPSFFDQSTGKMYKNTDFERINFPSDDAIKKYYMNS
ncbi:MAG: hypothetical protein ACI4S3_03040 [Candidatus Gastranaerophilaceae bacterium]